MESRPHTQLIGNPEVQAMLGMQSISGLNKLRVRDKTFPKPIKTSDARQANPVSVRQLPGVLARDRVRPGRVHAPRRDG